MARKKIGLKKVAQRKPARRKRGSFSREKKLAVVRAHKAGIPASKLGAELRIQPVNIYLWAKEVKKKGEKKAFLGGKIGRPPKRAKLLRAAPTRQRSNSGFLAPSSMHIGE